MKKLDEKRSKRLQKAYEGNLAQARLWRDALKDYNSVQFKHRPTPTTWSIGQVYAHILGGAHQFFFDHVEKCLKGEKTENGSKKLPGRLIFLLGSFPPIRIRMPEAIQKRIPKEFSTEMYQPKIKEVQPILDMLPGQLEKWRKKIEEEYDPTRKRKHPALGYLDALEWYELNEMHFRHHLRQKKRIDAVLRAGQIK